MNKNPYRFFVILIFSSTFLMLFTNNYKGYNIRQFDNMGIDCNLHRKLIQKGVSPEEMQNQFQDIEFIEKSFVIHNSEGKLKTEELVIKKRPLLNCLDATDPYLAYVIGRDLLVRPATKHVNYALDNLGSLELESHQQALDVMEMVFKFQLKKGLFIEAGAADCEFSETLPLEYKYGWTGVLLEPNMKDFETCKKVGRQAYLMHTCLGTQNTPYFAQFNFQSAGHDNHTKTTAMGGFAKQGDTHEIQCFPLESILAAINNPTVNLFVLDIEGFELAVLRAINWDKVDIEVLTVEIEHAGEFMKDSSPQIIDDFMESKGYKRFRHRKRKHHITGEDLDALYVRNDIVSKYNVVQL